MSFLAELDPALDALPVNNGYSVQVGSVNITAPNLGGLIDRLEPLLDDDRIWEIIEEQQSFQSRFPSLYGPEAQLDLTVTDVVMYEREARRQMAEADLPPSFYDDPVTDIQGFITQGVSISELGDRIALARAGADLDDDFRRQISEESGYDLTTGDIAAYYLDPDRGTDAIIRDYTRAQARVAVNRFDLTDESVERLTSTVRSLDPNELRNQSLVLSRLSALEGLTTGSTRVTESVAVGAALGEQDALQEVQREIGERQAEFSGGGGFAAGGQGFGGLGTGR